MMPSAAHSQTTEDDKVWLYRKDALKVKAAADSFKIAKVELQLLRTDLKNTTAAVDQLKTAVYKAEVADSICTINLKIANQKDSLRLKHIELAEANAANWEKLYKKEHRRRAITGFAGVIATVAAVVIPVLIK